MREINMMDGKKILISMEEYEKMEKILGQSKGGFIKTKDDQIINTASISSIAIPEVEAYFWGNKMNKSKTRVLVDGEWKIFAGNETDIEYRVKNHPELQITGAEAKNMLIGGSKDVVVYDFDDKE